MPTFDDDIPQLYLPKAFKPSKQALKVHRSPGKKSQVAAIRLSLSGNQSEAQNQLDLEAILDAFKMGKIPSNDQLCRGLEKIHAMIVRGTSSLDDDQLLNDLEKLTQSIEKTIQAKNAKSEMQRFLYYSGLASKSVPASDAGLKISDILLDRNFLDEGKKFLLLVVTDNDFRQVLVEFSRSISSMLRDAPKADEKSECPTAQVKREEIQTAEEIIASHPRSKVVLHFLDFAEEICEDRDHFLGIDFLISCVRKFERGIKENVLFRQASEGEKIDVNMEEAMKYFVAILENFAGHSLDALWSEIKKFGAKIKPDYKLRTIIDELITFMERSLRDESFRRDPDTRLIGCNLLDKSMTYISSKCAENIDCIFKETSMFLDSVQSDSDVQALSKSSSSFYDDLYYKIGDKKVLNQDLLKDLIFGILPQVVNQIQTIKFPKLSKSTPKFDYKVEKLEIPVDDFLPSFIEYKISKGIIMGLRDAITDQKYSTVSIVSHEQHLNISYIPYSYQIKSGLVRLNDQGNFGLKTRNKGISIKLKLLYFPQDPKKTLEIENASIFMDKIKLEIHGQKHEKLYYFLRPAISTWIRSQFTKSLETAVKDFVKRVDAIITARKVHFTKKIAKTKAAAQTMPTKAPPEKINTLGIKQSSSWKELFPWETNAFDLAFV